MNRSIRKPPAPSETRAAIRPLRIATAVIVPVSGMVRSSDRESRPHTWICGLGGGGRLIVPAERSYGTSASLPVESATSAAGGEPGMTAGAPAGMPSSRTWPPVIESSPVLGFPGQNVLVQTDLV